MGYLALGAVEAGALEDAARTIPVALDAAGEPGVGEHFVAALPHLAAAAFRSASGRPEPAARAAERALALARRGAGRLELAVVLGVWAQTGAATGRETQRELDQARALARECPDPGQVVARLARIRLPRAAGPTAQDARPRTAPG